MNANPRLHHLTVDSKFGQSNQASRFLLLYALAAAGGSAAYVPFLTILLPMQVSELAGREDIEWLAYLTFAGAIAASLGNIFFGWLSDITGHRRSWIFAGFAGSSALLVCFAWTEDLYALILLIIAWQLALNMMLAPLMAWAGDTVPHQQKGYLGGLLAFAPAFGAFSAMVVTVPGLAGAEDRLWIVVAMVGASILPVLLIGNPVKMPELHPQNGAGEGGNSGVNGLDPTVIRMWLARLLIQIAEAALFAYLYFWFQSVDPSMDDARTAQVLTVALVLAIPVTLVVGRWSDRREQPILPLPISAAIAGLGLLAMALSGSLLLAIAGYLLCKLSLSVFLSLHAGQTLRILPRSNRRGHDLGLFNLTNTVPSLVMPWLVFVLVPIAGFPALMVLLAVLSFAACALLIGVRPAGGSNV